MKPHITLATLFTLFTFCILTAQTFTPEEALQKFAKYPQERIYVKFDKADYLAGETMHFKAYVFAKFNLSHISTNLYFEYLDKNKKVIYKNILPVYTGIAEGSFSIPKELTEDVYFFRAYTAWMLNFDERLQFIKPINIYNPSSQTKLVEQPAEWFATLHPEGETLLDNVETKVAVRLHSADILPKNFSGYLFENTDSSKRISEINFLNNEIGSTDLLPAFGKNYSVKLTDDNGKSKVISLPKILQQGVTIQTLNSPSAIDYSITSKGFADGLKGCKIVAQNQGELIYSAIIKNSADAVNASIPLDSLTKGIVQITVFDAKGNAAAERLCFAYPKILNAVPQVQLSKNSSAQKGLNEWPLEADTISNYTYLVEVASNENYTLESPDFLTTFWLGELSSTSFKNEYLTAQNANAQNALDLLLMSEKWGRFDWNTFLMNPVPKLKYAPDNFLTWQGEALHNKKPLRNEKLSIVIQLPDSARVFIPVNTDSLGNFVMKNIDFRDTAKVFFRLNDINKSATDIDVVLAKVDAYKPYSAQLPPSLYISTERKINDTVPQKIKNYISALNSFESDDRYKILTGVVVNAKAKNPTQELNKKLSSPPFNDPGEIVFDFINDNKDEASGGIIDWLNGKVPGMTVDGGIAYMRGQPVKIYINEFIADYNQLNSYPVTDIAMVKVLRTPFMLGSGAPVVAVYTKTAGLFKPETVLLKSIKIAGYQTVEKFNSVDYSDAKMNTAIHDTRDILYWNTHVSPEKNKQAIKFYNNDISRSSVLIIFGFDKKGIPVYLNKEISF